MAEEPMPTELVIGDLLDEWGTRAGLPARSSGHGVIRSWSDDATEFAVRRDGDQHVVENVERGEMRSWARFGSVSEAETFLLGRFVAASAAASGRAGRMPSGLAPGASLEAGSGGYRLVDTEGRVSLFRRRTEAETYSGLAALTPAQITALPPATR